MKTNFKVKQQMREKHGCPSISKTQDRKCYKKRPTVRIWFHITMRIEKGNPNNNQFIKRVSSTKSKNRTQMLLKET
uniref:Uncharacterized protein n=1 Tax=Rhizophora mucronata TaxID=61149 RepID=A0A2P2N923_RHIMU